MLSVFHTPCGPSCAPEHSLIPDISQHTHEIGLANLPFTKKGRKAASQEKDRVKKNAKATSDAGAANSNANANASTSSSPSVASTTASPSAMPPQRHDLPSPVSMLAPLPAPYGQPPPIPYPPYLHPHPHPYAGSIQPHDLSISLAQDRWERMTVLFHSIREHARGFEYPGPSVVALESILIRLYLESPMGVGVRAHAGGMEGGMVQSGMAQVPPQGQNALVGVQVVREGGVNGVSGVNSIGEEGS
jgi:hypothetical protein